MAITERGILVFDQLTETDRDVYEYETLAGSVIIWDEISSEVSGYAESIYGSIENTVILPGEVYNFNGYISIEVYRKSYIFNETNSRNYISSDNSYSNYVAIEVNETSYITNINNKKT